MTPLLASTVTYMLKNYIFPLLHEMIKPPTKQVFPITYASSTEADQRRLTDGQTPGK